MTQREIFIENLKKEFAPLEPFIPRSIFIAIPAHDRREHIQCSLSWATALVNLQTLDFPVQVHPQFNGGITEARQEIIAEFMNVPQSPDALVFLDSDIAFEWNALRRIIFAPYPITINAYPKKSLDLDKMAALIRANDPNWRSKMLEYPVNLAEKFRKGKEPISLSPGGFVECQSGATGFMRVKREVIGTICTNQIEHLNYLNDAKEIRYQLFPFQRHYDKDRCKMVQSSEDLSFCNLALKEGFATYADAKMGLTHLGEFAYEGNFGKAIGL